MLAPNDEPRDDGDDEFKRIYDDAMRVNKYMFGRIKRAMFDKNTTKLVNSTASPLCGYLGGMMALTEMVVQLQGSMKKAVASKGLRPRAAEKEHFMNLLSSLYDDYNKDEDLP